MSSHLSDSHSHLSPQSFQFHFPSSNGHISGDSQATINSGEKRRRLPSHQDQSSQKCTRKCPCVPAVPTVEPPSTICGVGPPTSMDNCSPPTPCVILDNALMSVSASLQHRSVPIPTTDQASWSQASLAQAGSFARFSKLNTSRRPASLPSVSRSFSSTPSTSSAPLPSPCFTPVIPNLVELPQQPTPMPTEMDENRA